MELGLKEYVTLVVSFVAMFLSIYNLYVQQFRRREKLLGSMFSVGVGDSGYECKLEYLLSNVGDVQIAVKQAEVLTDDGCILDAKVNGLPIVLKSGEVVLVDIFYNEPKGPDEQVAMVEFGVFSATGNAYRLPHSQIGGFKNPDSIWDVFELGKQHKGF